MSPGIGPYSPSITHGEWIVTSGQIGVVTTGDGVALVEGGFEAELHQALHNLAGVLVDAGVTLDSVLKATVYLADMGDYAALNAVWGDFFSGIPRPVRTVVAVAALPLGARIEIEAWAHTR